MKRIAGILLLRYIPHGPVMCSLGAFHGLERCLRDAGLQTMLVKKGRVVAAIHTWREFLKQLEDGWSRPLARGDKIHRRQDCVRKLIVDLNKKR